MEVTSSERMTLKYTRMNRKRIFRFSIKSRTLGGAGASSRTPKTRSFHPLGFGAEYSARPTGPVPKPLTFASRVVFASSVEELLELPKERTHGCRDSLLLERMGGGAVLAGWAWTTGAGGLARKRPGVLSPYHPLDSAKVRPGRDASTWLRPPLCPQFALATALLGARAAAGACVPFAGGPCP